MTQPTADASPAIDPNAPFTRGLLRSLAGTIRAQPNETDAEYEERFAAATTAWAAFRPSDPMEQMLAAQIVGAHYASLDCLNQAMATDDPALAVRLQRSQIALTRAMREMMRLLERKQRQSADTVPPPRRRPPAAKPEQHPIHRENAPAAPMKDLAKMTDEELEAAQDEIRTRCGIALFHPKDPMHRDALALLPEILPGVVVPASYFQDPPPLAA